MATTTFGEFYTTGTVTLTTDSVDVTGSGVLWTDIEQGDTLESQGFFGTVGAVTDDTITLMLPWAGAGGSGLDYVLHKDAKSRFDPALMQAKLREMLATLADATIFYNVAGAAPDPGIGEDGNYAIKTNAGAWQQWHKESGSWVEQATPVGITNKGVWSSLTNYVVNDVVVRLDVAYISRTSNLNSAPESNSSDWSLLFSSGRRFDIPISAAGKPSSGENLLGVGVLMSAPVSFAVNMAESQAYAATPATSSAIFSLRKNGVQFATLTFAAPNHAGTFTAATPVSFAIGDLLSVIAPAQDATLSDLAITLTGYR